METLIELRNADVPRMHFPSAFPVLEDVNWWVQRGEFWILGALPGAGKTDFLCAAAGLLRVTMGSQILFGKDMEDMSEEELVSARLRIAMVFTGGRLFNGLTVAQNISLPLSYHKSGHDNLPGMVSAALDSTGLAAYADRRPGQIPRGVHQRIGLARALALEPEVLLVDNPLAGTDARQARWWLDSLCELNKKLTVVVATDDLRAWTDVGNQFGLIREKKLEVIGGRDQVKSSGDTLVKELLRPAFDS